MGLHLTNSRLVMMACLPCSQAQILAIYLLHLSPAFLQMGTILPSGSKTIWAGSAAKIKLGGCEQKLIFQRTKCTI